MRSREEVEAMRVECNRPNFKKAVYAMHGKSCVNCGSVTDIDLHHIVPLHMGGTNNLRNVVPLCYDCHCKVHSSKDVWKEHMRRSEKSKRPREIPEGYEKILDDYLHCRISMTELKELFGWTKPSQKLNDRVWFKEYLDAHKIVKYRNNIDNILKHGNIKPFASTGYLQVDGEGQEHFHADIDFYIRHTTEEQRKMEAQTHMHTADKLGHLQCPVCGAVNVGSIGHVLRDTEYVPIMLRIAKQWHSVDCEKCHSRIGSVKIENSAICAAE